MPAILARRHAWVVFLRCAVAGVRGAAGAAVPTHRGIEFDAGWISGISLSCVYGQAARSMPLSRFMASR